MTMRSDSSRVVPSGSVVVSPPATVTVTVSLITSSSICQIGSTSTLAPYSINSGGVALNSIGFGALESIGTAGRISREGVADPRCRVLSAGYGDGKIAGHHALAT